MDLEGHQGNPIMKCSASFALIVACLALLGPLGHASWFIDARRFHISTHGQISCLDCHGDAAQRGLHPNPDDVNKDLGDFFRADQCASCHDDVMEDLDNGFHGSTKVNERKEYARCIRCHDPHYQIRETNPMGQFDPSTPRSMQCGACHESREVLPELSPEDETCMACHGSVAPEDPRGTERVSRFCFHCHGQTEKGEKAIAPMKGPSIDVTEYGASTHDHLSCLSCHPQAAQFKHASQRLGDCRRCHLPHDEKVARDAHRGVACEACHLSGIEPVRDPESRLVLWRIDRKPGIASKVHNMTTMRDEDSCQRCHFRGNTVGAAAVVLPAKSIMCMPCHAGTASVGDPITVVSLVLFLLGLLTLSSVWFSGASVGGIEAGIGTGVLKLVLTATRRLFSSKVLSIFKALVLDILLQRRLWRQSRTRWLIHSLIFLPFVFRFIWGLAALLCSLWAPERSLAWIMLDKNHPVCAFLFDLTGVMVIFGVILALLRRGLTRSDRLAGLPRQDLLALSLMGCIIIVGFILEGMRIAMTGSPDGAEYAFLGNGIGLLLTGASGLTDKYGCVWYLHAILTGAFVAYLPFSRMFHIIMAPLVLIMNAASGDENGQRKTR